MGKSNTMTGALAGDITLRLFRALPNDVLAWAARAWADYATTGTEPDDVPAKCLAAWVAIKGECDNLKAAREAAIECGKRGGRPRKNKPAEAENENPPFENKTPLSKTKPPLQKTGGGFENENQKNLDTDTDTDIDTDIPPSGGDSCARVARGGGENPAPPPPPIVDNSTPIVDNSASAELVAAMSGAPLTASEAVAAGRASGLSEEQVTEWAHYYATREWTVNVGSVTVPMNKRKAIASLGSWSMKERNFQAERELRAKGRTDKDETIRGVRVANKGDDLGDWGK